MYSQDELNVWVKLYSEKLVRIASMYTPDIPSAEDRVQDAFIKAFKSMGQLKERGKPFPWLVRIVINECRSAHRKNWREIATSVFPQYTVNGPEEDYMESLKLKAIYTAVSALPDKYKTPIVLHYYEDLSVTEVAEIMQINTNTVKTRLARGRERLTKALQEEEDAENGFGCKVIECKNPLL